MRPVLFVEHNEQLIQGYRRLLRGFSASWDLRFVADTTEAVKLAAGGAVEVVIVDIRVEGLDGVLLELRARAPKVARVVLAGPDTKPETAMGVAVLAHQLIRKPFIPPQLFELVERTCEVIRSLASPRLQVVLGQMGTLPAMPRTYSALVELSADPRATLDQVAAVVERDPAISAAVLKIINSAYFGLPRRVSSVRESVKYLGIKHLKNIVLTVEVYEGLGGGRIAGLEQEALARACAMREVLGRTPMAETAFAAGILADVGWLLLATRLPLDAAAITKATGPGRTRCDAERERLGCTHADIGAAMLAQWNLPAELVEAIALHHRPPAAPAPTVATALALVTVMEHLSRAGSGELRQLTGVAQHLAQAFPTVSLELVGRYFASADAASA